MIPGFYLTPNIYVRRDGTIFGLVDDGKNLGAINWEKIGDFAGDMFDKVIQLKSGSNQQAQLAAQQQALLQAQLAAQNQNPLAQLGGLSPMMLIILALAGVVLFMKK
jgi:hypothetical protein